MQKDDPQTGLAHDRLRQAFSDIIDGRIVKRSVHPLRWADSDMTDHFVQVLKGKGYLALQVREVVVLPGERIPAFYIDGSTAYFGWVFWEKFSDRKLRKLFGSVIRNGKGDWAVQIPEGKATPVYACPPLKIEMDIDNPSGM